MFTCRPGARPGHVPAQSNVVPVASHPRVTFPWKLPQARAMPDTISHCMSEDITRKWHELAEKRREHFVELYESGRWQHYYSESEFLTLMREVVNLSEAWSKLTTVPPQVPAE
jgi:hypothetical protein